MSGAVVGVERVAGGGAARPQRWRLPVLLVGILFAHGRRTVTTWLRAAGVSDDFQDYYYFLARIGRKTESVATQLLALVLPNVPLPDRLLAVIDDSPTKRYGPKVEGADIHRNPTPGPADQKYLYGHIWVTLSLAVRHPRWGALALPLRAMLYVRQQTMAKIPHIAAGVFAPSSSWRRAGRVDRSDRQKSRKNAVDRRRWRLHEMALLEARSCRGRRGRRPLAPRRGAARSAAAAAAWPAARSRPSAQVRQEQDQPGQAGRPKGWLANGRVHGLRQDGHQDLQDLPGDLSAGRRRDSRRDRQGGSRLVPFFSTDPNATVVEIIEAFADRATIEQDFHDVKEVWGAGQQQVRNIWTNVAVYHLNLWMHTLVELWAWNRSHDELRSQRVALGRPPTSSVARRSSQSLTSTNHPTRIIDDCRRLAAAAKNPPTDRTPHDARRLT